MYVYLSFVIDHIFHFHLRAPPLNLSLQLNRVFFIVLLVVILCFLFFCFCFVTVRLFLHFTHYFLHNIMRYAIHTPHNSPFFIFRFGFKPHLAAGAEPPPYKMSIFLIITRGAEIEIVQLQLFLFPLSSFLFPLSSFLFPLYLIPNSEFLIPNSLRLS